MLSFHYLLDEVIDPHDTLAIVMATARNVHNPIVRTYLTKTITPSGKTIFHVRIVSRRHNLDKRGSGDSAQQAREKALAGLQKPR